MGARSFFHLDMCARCARAVRKRPLTFPFPAPAHHAIFSFRTWISYGVVQAAVGVGTVLIWDFCVPITRGGGTNLHTICLPHSASSVVWDLLTVRRWIPQRLQGVGLLAPFVREEALQRSPLAPPPNPTTLLAWNRQALCAGGGGCWSLFPGPRPPFRMYASSSRARIASTARRSRVEGWTYGDLSHRGRAGYWRERPKAMTVMGQARPLQPDRIEAPLRACVTGDCTDHPIDCWATCMTLMDPPHGGDYFDCTSAWGK